MACYGCSSKFTLINKEKSCKNCGFSYCKSCLKQSIAVPKRQNAVCEVCGRCFTQLSKGVSNPEPTTYELPQNFVKQREERLKREQEESRARASKLSTNVPSNSAVSDTDQLRARLDALRVTPSAAAESEASLRSRLEMLRGAGAAGATGATAATRDTQTRQGSSNGLFFVPPPRSQSQQVDQLLDEIMSEARIDDATQQDRKDAARREAETLESIASRLSRLAAETNALGVPPVDVDAVLRNSTGSSNFGRIETLRISSARANRSGSNTMDMDDSDEDEEDLRTFECSLCGADRQLELFTCKQCDDVRRVCGVCFRALHNANEYDFLKGHSVQRLLFD